MPINNANRMIMILVGTQLVTYAVNLSLVREAARQKEKTRNLAKFVVYLVNLLEEHDVPLNEFDAIALNDMIREYNAQG